MSTDSSYSETDPRRIVADYNAMIDRGRWDQGIATALDNLFPVLLVHRGVFYAHESRDLDEFQRAHPSRPFDPVSLESGPEFGPEHWSSYTREAKAVYDKALAVLTGRASS